MVRLTQRFTGVLAALATASCGGGSVTPTASAPTATTAPAATQTQTSLGQCSLRDRQDFVLAALREWYLFPETLPAAPNPAAFGTVDDYLDSLTATARGQQRDRFFTFLTSIAEDNAFFSSGSSAGFGIRISSDAATQRSFVAEAFEGAPAFAAGIDRGSELLAIGETPATLRRVADIIAQSGIGGVSEALGPPTPGTTRTIRFANAGAVRDVTIAKADYELIPVSPRYGARVIEDGGKRVGYVNLRTFISTADAPLRAAFSDFRAQGITEFVIDLRYNGGGLVSTAELFADLLGGARSGSDVQSVTTYRPEKSSRNRTRNYARLADAVAPTRIAFITTPSSASASELVINAQLPYLGQNIALIGGNTGGKPVGQIGIDRAACDDRLRVVAFSTQNGAGGGFYYQGLAANVPNTCRAGDDVTRPFGDPQEASTRQALDFLAGRTCTPIATGTQAGQSARSGQRLLTPQRPTAAQREVPGLF